MAYGYNDSVGGSSSKTFGLNQHVKMVDFMWTNTAGKEGAEMEAIIAQFLFPGDDKPMKYYIFPVRKAFYKEKEGGILVKKETTDPKHPEFVKAEDRVSATITMIMKAYCNDEKIENAIKNAKPTSFAEYAKCLTSILPKNYSDIEVDIFLQWQYSMRDGKMTYLEIPSNTMSGRFICAHMKANGEWKEERTISGMKYVDDNGNIHPFTRSANFMLSTNSKQQKMEDDVSGFANTPNADKKDDWDN